jgi:outer membrane protein TolC
VGLVVASLLAVVVGNMALASGQLQLEQAQSRVAQVESKYAVALNTLNVLKNPATIAHDAAIGGLVAPSQAPLSLPHVSLTRRLPAQRVSYLPCCTFTPGQ